MGRSEVSVMKWSEGISQRVFIIITRYEVCCLYDCFVYHIFSYSFSSIFYHCVYGCMFCMLLFNFVQVYLMYSYCYLCTVQCILFHCVVLCTVCV
jgi:hypothetical protein